MNDPHDSWLKETLQPLRDVPPSPRQNEIRAQLLAEAVSDVALPRPNEQVTHTKKERSMFIVNRNRTLAASIALVLGIFASFFVSPNLRAIAQEIIDTFIVREPTNVIQDEISILSASAENTPEELSIEQAQDTLGYKLTLPDTPANNYEFKYVTLIQESDTVNIPFTNYVCTTPPIPTTPVFGHFLTIVQTPLSQALLQEKGRVGADAIIERIELGNGITGLYVRGRWDQGEWPTTLEIAEMGDAVEKVEGGVRIPVTAVWSNTLNQHNLIWIQGDWLFTINANGGETDETLCPLTKDDIIRMAQEMVNQTPDATPNPHAQEILDSFFVRKESNVKEDSVAIMENSAEINAYYEERELTLEEAEEQLGYSLLLPDDIPGAYTLEYVVLETYSEGFSAPIAQYICRLNVGGWGLSVTHETIDAPTFMGGSMSVGADAVIEKVELGNGVTGEYVRGMWTFPNVIPTPDAEGNISGGSIPVTSTWSNEENAHYLRWTMGDKNFEVFGTGATQDSPSCTLTKEDIIRMAQEMVNQTPEATPSADIEGMDEGFFVREMSNVKQTEMYFPGLSPSTPEETYEVRQLTVEEAERELGSPIIVPETVPGSFVYEHTILNEWENQIITPFTQYVCSGGSTWYINVTQTPLKEFQSTGAISVGADAVVEKLYFGDGIFAEYVKGNWDWESESLVEVNPTTGEITYLVEPGTTYDVTMQWDSTVNQHQIIWAKGDMVYSLSASGSTQIGAPCYLTLGDVAYMARNMMEQTLDADPNASTQEVIDGFFVRAGTSVKDEELYLGLPLNPTQNAEFLARFLTLEQAQAQLGYSLTLPTTIPGRFKFDSATIDDSIPTVMYTCIAGYGGRYIGIREWKVPGPLYLNNIEVGANANVERINLGNGVTASYVKGTWTTPVDSDGKFTVTVEPGEIIEYTSTWDNDSNHYTLQWTDGDTSFYMYTYGETDPEHGCYLRKIDVIRMAREMVSNHAKAGSD